MDNIEEYKRKEKRFQSSQAVIMWSLIALILACMGGCGAVIAHFIRKWW